MIYLVILSGISVCSAASFPSPWIDPCNRIWCVLVEIKLSVQPNRIRRRKPPHIRIIKPKRIEMQPRLPVQILPLKPQILLFNVIRLARLYLACYPISDTLPARPCVWGQLPSTVLHFKYMWFAVAVFGNKRKISAAAPPIQKSHRRSGDVRF